MTRIMTLTHKILEKWLVSAVWAEKTEMEVMLVYVFEWGQPPQASVSTRIYL